MVHQYPQQWPDRLKHVFCVKRQGQEQKHISEIQKHINNGCLLASNLYNSGVNIVFSQKRMIPNENSEEIEIKGMYWRHSNVCYACFSTAHEAFEFGRFGLFMFFQ